MIHSAADRGKAFDGALERHMLKAKSPAAKKHGSSRRRKSQKAHRRISRETRKLDLTV